MITLYGFILIQSGYYETTSGGFIAYFFRQVNIKLGITISPIIIAVLSSKWKQMGSCL